MQKPSTPLIGSSVFRIKILCLSVLALSACTVVPPKPPLVETVAVLRFDNSTNNLNADDVMQKWVYSALKPSAYRVTSLAESNAFLDKIGIIDGGQLAAIDPVKLGKDLNVQALLYGSVENFGYLNVGFYRHRKVVIELKLVDASNGTTLWEAQGKGMTSKMVMSLSEAASELFKGVTDQALDKVLKNPLEEESKTAVKNGLSTLPGFQFHGFSSDDALPNAAEPKTETAVKDILQSK